MHLILGRLAQSEANPIVRFGWRRPERHLELRDISNVVDRRREARHMARYEAAICRAFDRVLPTRQRQLQILCTAKAGDFWLNEQLSDHSHTGTMTSLTDVPSRPYGRPALPRTHRSVFQVGRMALPHRRLNSARCRPQARVYNRLDRLGLTRIELVIFYKTGQPRREQVALDCPHATGTPMPAE